MQVKDFSLSDEIAEVLPKPKGYRVLVACPQIEEKTQGGIIIAEDLRKKESTASIIGFVVDMGSEAYSDLDKFPDGAYCSSGDWVIFRSYSGTRFKISGQEFRLINDDTVEATVSDPRSIERA
tara:strand:+ start:6827 stop:7195 length:369 start_codon:yes stop_codon:yes gene_type:complete